MVKENSSPRRRNTSLTIVSEPQGSERLPQAPKNDTPNTLGVEDIEFVNIRHTGEYTSQMPTEAERIIDLGLYSGSFKNYSPLLHVCIGVVFRYYQQGPSQPHPNRWIILFSFDKFLRLVEIEPTISVFRTCYHLVADIDGGNDMCWFFTFAERPI